MRQSLIIRDVKKRFLTLQNRLQAVFRFYSSFSFILESEARFRSQFIQKTQFFLKKIFENAP